MVLLSSTGKTKVNKSLGTPGVLIASNKACEDKKREREVLGLKDEETQKAWHWMKFWNPTRILEKFDAFDADVQKYGRRWYESLKLCLEGVPSFKFNNYYNVVVLLNENGFCTQDEAWELFDIASKKLKRISK